METYLLLGAWGVGPDVERVSTRLECGVGLGSTCCAGWDDAQHFLLNNTCREERGEKRGEGRGEEKANMRSRNHNWTNGKNSKD